MKEEMNEDRRRKTKEGGNIKREKEKDMKREEVKEDRKKKTG